MAHVRRKDTGKPGNKGLFDHSRDLPTTTKLVNMRPLVPMTPACERLVEDITAAGGRPYLVGGCVRDALWGHEHIKDVDIEVFGLDAETLASTLATHGRVDETGKSFAVFKVGVGDEDFDVSLPRTERKTGSGHRGFEVTPDPWASTQAAAARRDFTINSIMYDPQVNTLVDHYGGAEDLANGVLRHTSEAFAEDPLRVLRGVQLAGRFGLTMHPETVALCQKLSDEFGTLPKERVWEEFSKLTSRGTHISNALNVLADTGWEKHLPEIAALHHIEQSPKWHPEGNVHVHTGMAADAAARLAREAGLSPQETSTIVLAAMCHDFGKATHTQHVTNDDGETRITSHGHAEAGVWPAIYFLNRIGAPRAVVEKVSALTEHHMFSSSLSGEPNARVIRRFIRRLEPATLDEWMLVHRADRLGRGSASADPDLSRWVEIAEAEKNRMKPVLTGHHLIARGMTPGPEFKVILSKALDAQDSGEFDDENGALEWLERNL